MTRDEEARRWPIVGPNASMRGMRGVGAMNRSIARAAAALFALFFAGANAASPRDGGTLYLNETPVTEQSIRWTETTLKIPELADPAPAAPHEAVARGSSGRVYSVASQELPPGWVVADRTGAGGHGTRGVVGLLWPPAGDPQGRRPPLLVAAYLTEGPDPLAARDAVLRAVGAAIFGAAG